MSESRVIVTITVAPTPPTLGRSLASMRSSSSVNAAPAATGVGRLWRTSAGSCLAQVSAWIALASIAPCNAGMENRPLTIPCPSEANVSLVRSAARRSSSSNSFASCASPTSGATTVST